MARQLFSNNFQTTLSGTLAQGGTTMVCASGEGNAAPTITGGDYFLLTLFTKDAYANEINIEVVQVTARTGDTFTIVRDCESMTGQAGGLSYNGLTDTVYIELRMTAAGVTNFAQTPEMTAALATKQPIDATLTALAGVTTAADKIIYATAADTFSTATLTAAGRALVDDADAAAQRTTLGLVIGTDVQAYDADLTTWAGVTPGTGVATALAINIGSSGAVVTNGGALGTPSSGTVTNLTGTASININGTVGATTPASVAATTIAGTSSATLGAVGGAIGSVVLKGSTSGTTTLTTDATATKATLNKPLEVTGGITGTTSATLGAASGATGSVIFKGTTSGAVTLSVADVAGTYTLKLPATDGDANQLLQTDGAGNCTWVTGAAGDMLLGTAQTVTANKSFNDGTVILKGATSGTTVFKAAAEAGTTTITMPASTGTVALTTSTVAKATTLETTRAIYGNNFDGSAALTGIIASTYGGTGNGYAKFTGPTTAEKTFTLPDANATLLYSGGAGAFSTIAGTSSATLGAASGATGSVVFKGTTSGAVTLSVADVAGTYTLKLPNNDGDANQVLKTDGSGNTSWATVAAGGATVVRSARTSNTKLVVADNSTLIDITSGTFSQTFDAAATLASGWFCYIKNSGTGVVTLDPDGAELIDGAATLVLPSKTVALIQCTGTAFTSAFIAPTKTMRLPIFAASAATMSAATALELAYNVTADPLLTPVGVVTDGTIFVAYSGAATDKVASSADGRTWTLRTMPSSAAWIVRSDGTGFMAIVNNSTATAYSADGITWASAAALDGNSTATTTSFAAVSGVWIVRGSASTTTIYKSTDNGSSWSTVTAAAANLNNNTSTGNVFVSYASTPSTYYTSTTAATSSWTSRSPPAGCDMVVPKEDGSLIARGTTSLVVNFQRSTNGVDWSSLGFAPVMAAGESLIENNGVYYHGSDTTAAYSRHNGAWTRRGQELLPSTTVIPKTALMGTVIVALAVAGGQKVYVIDATAADAATAVFTG